MTFFWILVSNVILYAVLRIHLVRKFRNTYSIYLKDSEGNRQTLSDTIAYIPVSYTHLTLPTKA